MIVALYLIPLEGAEVCCPWREPIDERFHGIFADPPEAVPPHEAGRAEFQPVAG